MTTFSLSSTRLLTAVTTLRRLSALSRGRWASSAGRGACTRWPGWRGPVTGWWPCSASPPGPGSGTRHRSRNFSGAGQSTETETENFYTDFHIYFFWIHHISSGSECLPKYYSDLRTADSQYFLSTLSRRRIISHSLSLSTEGRKNENKCPLRQSGGFTVLYCKTMVINGQTKQGDNNPEYCFITYILT